MFWVYVVECERDSHFYVGQTNNMTRRARQHHRGNGHAFTRIHGCRHVFPMFPCATREEALEVERKLAETLAARPRLFVRSDGLNPYAGYQTESERLGYVEYIPD